MLGAGPLALNHLNTISSALKSYGIPGKDSLDFFGLVYYPNTIPTFWTGVGTFINKTRTENINVENILLFFTWEPSGGCDSAQDYITKVQTYWEVEVQKIRNEYTEYADKIISIPVGLALYGLCERTEGTPAKQALAGHG